MGVFHPDLARLDPPDPPGAVAQEEDVAGQALDGEIFIEAADECFRGFLDDVVIRRVGDRAAGSDRGEARAAPALDSPVHPVMVKVGASAARLGGDSLGQHTEDFTPFPVCQIPVWKGAADHFEKLGFPHIPCRGRGDHLLGEDVEGFLLP